MPTWAKVAIGCGCFLVLILIVGFLLLGWGAKKGMEKLKEEGVDVGQAVEALKNAENNPGAAVEAIIAMNPGLELVENDPGSGKITVKNTETGEVGTFDYSDIENGRFSFEGKDGSYSVDAGAAADGEGIQVTGPDGQTTRIGSGAEGLPAWIPVYPDVVGERGGMTTESGDRASGLVAFKTPADLETVEAWYAERLENDGCAIERNSMDFNGNRQISLQCTKAGIDTLAVVVGREQAGQETGITITYEGPKQ